ncbi:hypothetical protein GALMADRAFT_76553 [Galerina marginata CBS 339.88]|uniref:Probable RNA-binding protein 18 n=1 Tax=Galerina marginata (strain CBS 339.88) TaxID=685588 RepID=A0A067SU26_GALM3|nr:hypothetical protein GALMADRAFT_76553 [Galerina marginata CBS 339.88]
MASSSAVTLDDLASSASATPVLGGPLFYPKPDGIVKERSKSPNEQLPRQLLKDRLYIGNLHPTVDEYTLLQVFSKFGKVTKLDYLFHKTGLLKGKPRGYAFIEYGDNDEALKALTMAHEKPLRGRKLVVTFAHQAPLDQYGGVGSSSLKNRKTVMDTGRPTTLSMLKTGMSNRNEGTVDKIAQMEAKLRQMERTNPRPKPTNPSGDIEMDSPSPSGSATPPTSSLPYHPSLPSKPPPALPAHMTVQLPPKSNTPPTTRPKVPLPSLPMLPPSNGLDLLGKPLQKLTSTPGTSATSSQPRPAKSSKLIGVKIKSKKEKGQTDVMILPDSV